MAVIPEILWKRGNTLVVNTRSFVLASRDRAVEIETYIEGELLEKKGKEFIVSLNSPIALCCGEAMSLEKATAFVKRQAQEFVTTNKKGLVRITIATMPCKVFWHGITYMIPVLGK